ncbi:MAG: O-antigen ligase family protein [Vicinamibacterales bacterium]
MNGERPGMGVDRPSPRAHTADAERGTWARRAEAAGVGAVIALAVTAQFSIVAAEAMLAIAVAAWVVTLWLGRERPAFPRMFRPLAAYAGLTLVSVAFSLAPDASLRDSKQLLLYLVVPVVYRFAAGRRADNLAWVVITAGAFSAIWGIVQYGVLQYNVLELRPRGSLGHWMTYSGTLMLVLGLAVSRILFRPKDRTWPLLVMPALIVALVLTFTRSAWVGASVAVGLLLLMKDFRLVALLPVAAALFFGLAPAKLTDRFYSMFDPRDPTSRDRMSMLGAGIRMVRDHPLTGVGPDVVLRVYPLYRDAGAVEPDQPHLHNVPIQIAAERGLPALAVWAWFVVFLAVSLWHAFRRAAVRSLPAGGLAAVAGMLAAGMFEHNFGDSEFLMLFLLAVTVPFAAERVDGEGADSPTQVGA